MKMSFNDTTLSTLSAFAKRHDLILFCGFSGPIGSTIAYFLSCYVDDKNGCRRIFGVGDTMEDAMLDYVDKISGKRLVYYTCSRKIEVGNLK